MVLFLYYYVKKSYTKLRNVVIFFSLDECTSEKHPVIVLGLNKSTYTQIKNKMRANNRNCDKHTYTEQMLKFFVHPPNISSVRIYFLLT